MFKWIVAWTHKKNGTSFTRKFLSKSQAVMFKRQIEINDFLQVQMWPL